MLFFSRPKIYRRHFTPPYFTLETEIFQDEKKKMHREAYQSKARDASFR